MTTYGDIPLFHEPSASALQPSLRLTHFPDTGTVLNCHLGGTRKRENAQVMAAGTSWGLLEHPEQVLTTLVALGLALIYVVRTSRRNAFQKTSSAHAIARRHRLPCPPSTLPFLGNTLDMVVYQRDRVYDWFLEQCELHKGPWRLQNLGRPPVIVVASPELFEDVTKTQFDLFPKGESECEIFRDFFGQGIFSLNGDAWHRQRATTSQLFAHPSMKKTMHDVVHAKIGTLCRVLHVYASRKGEPISLKSVLGHFAADVFTKMGMGVERSTLENGLQGFDSDDFIQSSRTISRTLQMRFHQPMWLWKLKRFLNIGDEKQFKECVKFSDFLMFNIINESIVKKNRAKRHRASSSGSTSSSSTSERSHEHDEPERERNPISSEAKDLISIFLETNALTESTAVDAQLIRDTVINFISPGTDTTAHAMSFFILTMNRYPQILKKIRKEIRTKLPWLMESDSTSRMLTVDDLAQLTYLEAAIRENLRLNPQYPLTGREACEDTVLSDGTFVPKGTRVVMAFYAAMRRKSVWGEDALRFKPERWLDPVTGQLIAVSPYKFPAFYAGPRMCPGMKFALVEIKMAMAVVLSRFDVRTVDNPWDLTYQVGLAASVKGSMLVTVTPILPVAK
ncbi:Cytochrome p450, partial [Globisporangium splendens]